MKTPHSHAYWSFAGAGEMADCPDSIENVHLEEDGEEHLLTHWNSDAWLWAEEGSYQSLEAMR